MSLLLMGAALAAGAPESSPSASPLPTADALAAGDGLIYLQPGMSLGGPTAHLGAQVGITDRLAFHAGAGMSGIAGFGDVALRYNVVNGEHVHVAPWVGLNGYILGSDGTRGWGPTAGLAIDAGGRVARVDLSVPVVTLNLASAPTFERDPVFSPVLFSRAGLTMRITERQRLRVGVDPFLAPTFDWNVDFARLSLGAGVDLVSLTQPGLHARAGWRF